MKWFFIAVGIIVCIVVILNEIEKNNTAKRLASLPKADYDKAVYGSVNEHLICPHCQTKGTVHVMGATRVVTSTGKVGGILKTDTKSQTIKKVTQHRCNKCLTIWDV